jgi:hypothetical protein
LLKEEIARIYSQKDTVIHYTSRKEENSRTYKNSESPLKMIGSPVCHTIPAGEKQGLEE